MKKGISIIAIALGLLLSFNTNAQKIGHIDAEQLLLAMPETKRAQDSITMAGKELERVLAELQGEYTKLVDTYVANEANWTTLTKDIKQKEIQDKQKRIQEFSQTAQQDIQQMEVRMLQPIIAKATKAVQEVAKEENFTYIIDSSPSKAVLLFSENGEDIMDKVKAKLGIAPKAP
tara:strand:+ start:111 stop:635 length:525 start_codon:yes stop_codon:yes gene_type:complete